MKKIELSLSQTKHYELCIGIDLFQIQLKQWQQYIGNNKVAIITNNKIKPLYGNKLKNQLRAMGFEVELLAILDGEKYKCIQTASGIYDFLMNNHFNRKSTIIALGGGVVGDLAGFVAATFMRGVNLVQIPTTLLAQVDSSIGGKTGVNHPLGKNMIGSFYQPDTVLIDPKLLLSLEDREYYSGFAEIIKYALIMDGVMEEGFFNWLLKNKKQLLAKNEKILAEAIYISCQCKAKVVEQDEKESGIRAILNLGHTFGHAIESSLGYGKWLHGEAVGLGMIWAAELSQQIGKLSLEDVKKIKAIISDFHLPTEISQSLDLDVFINHLLHDKKFENNQLRLILLKRIGEAYIENTLNLDEVSQFLNRKINPDEPH